MAKIKILKSNLKVYKLWVLYVTVPYFMDETTNIFKFQGQKLNLDKF